MVIGGGGGGGGGGAGEGIGGFSGDGADEIPLTDRFDL